MSKGDPRSQMLPLTLNGDSDHYKEGAAQETSAHPVHRFIKRNKERRLGLTSFVQPGLWGQALC